MLRHLCEGCAKPAPTPAPSPRQPRANGCANIPYTTYRRRRGSARAGLPRSIVSGASPLWGMRGSFWGKALGGSPSPDVSPRGKSSDLGKPAGEKSPLWGAPSCKRFACEA